MSVERGRFATFMCVCDVINLKLELKFITLYEFKPLGRITGRVPGYLTECIG